VSCGAVVLCRPVVDAGAMLTEGPDAELPAVIDSRDVPTVVATRTRIVLWTAEGRHRKDVAVLAEVSLPIVDRRLRPDASNVLAFIYAA
jgi:hypothetical protein